jgi:hypothetical protein
MPRSLMLTAVLMTGLTTVASAGFSPHSIGNSDGMLMRVAEGCGPGWWRDQGVGVIQWREGALARGDTTSVQKAAGAGRTEVGEAADLFSVSPSHPIWLGLFIWPSFTCKGSTIFFFQLVACPFLQIVQDA